jgi:hypothetical protein
MRDEGAVELLEEMCSEEPLAVYTKALHFAKELTAME